MSSICSIAGPPSIRARGISFPSKLSQRDGEDQRIGGNVQIKVGQTVHQNSGDTSDATETNSGVKAIFRLPVTPDGACEDPENRTKHQDASWNAKFADHFQIVAVGVVHKVVEESGLHRSISHGKRAQARTQQGMLVNQLKGVEPDRYAILAGLGVFLSKNLKAHDHGIASHPSNNSDDTEEKQSGDHGLSPLRQRGTSGQGQNGHERSEGRKNSHA